MKTTYTFRKYALFYLFLLLTIASSMRCMAQVPKIKFDPNLNYGHVDSLKTSAVLLMDEMDKEFEYWKKIDTFPGLHLERITKSEYLDTILLAEKLISSENAYYFDYIWTKYVAGKNVWDLWLLDRELSLDISQYDFEGNLVSLKTIDEECPIEVKTEIKTEMRADTVDVSIFENGLLKSRTKTYKNGDCRTHKTFDYKNSFQDEISVCENPVNRKIISYESNFIPKKNGYQKIYTYDQQGLLLKEVWTFPMYIYETLYKYDSKGQKILEESYEDGVLRGQIFREYDLHGNLLRVKKNTDKGIPVFQRMYVYDDKHNEIVYLFFEKN